MGPALQGEMGFQYRQGPARAGQIAGVIGFACQQQRRVRPVGARRGPSQRERLIEQARGRDGLGAALGLRRSRNEEAGDERGGDKADGALSPQQGGGNACVPCVAHGGPPLA